ncbi:hypothetical protein AAG906_038601 [Vitis piasezkii]
MDVFVDAKVKTECCFPQHQCSRCKSYKKVVPNPSCVLPDHAMPGCHLWRKYGKGFERHDFETLGGGINVMASSYSKLAGFGAEIVGTSVLVYVVLSATDAKRNARDSHVPILAPLPIGFVVFLVHQATIPITGTSINHARSLEAAIIYNRGMPRMTCGFSGLDLSLELL